MLDRHGFWEEALVLGAAGLCAAAERLVSDRRCLTCIDDAFPPQWRSDPSVPPACWCERLGHAIAATAVAVVGSRVIDREVFSWTREVAASLTGAGHTVFTGGAPGCDSAAMLGSLSIPAPVTPAVPLVVVLPCGLEFSSEFLSWGGHDMTKLLENRTAFLSFAAPHEPFHRRHAMERNAILYSAGHASVIAHARFKEGGTWHGAVAALRQRRPILIRSEDSAACRALVALGAFPVCTVAGVHAAAPVAPALFA